MQDITFYCDAKCMTACKEGLTDMGAGFWKLLWQLACDLMICSCWRGIQCAIEALMVQWCVAECQA